MDQCIELFAQGKFKRECVSLVVSKFLGYSIVFFSFTLKVPQIRNMIKMQSSSGLSALSIYTEFFMALLLSIYGYHKQSPISTYGECIVIFVQNFIIMILFWKYSKVKGSIILRGLFLILVIVFTYICIADFNLPELFWLAVGSSSIPLISISRISQIISSIKLKSTGPLSSFTYFLNAAGSLSRLFTIITESYDLILISSYIYSLVLNIIILTQIAIYRDNSAKKKAD